MSTQESTSSSVAPVVVGLVVFGGLVWVVKDWATRFIKNSYAECVEGVGTEGCRVLLDNSILVAKLQDGTVASRKLIGQETIDKARSNGFMFIEAKTK